MMERKRIVCLANSRKLNGRCIAGLELLENGHGPWIRPVSAREHEEVSEYERQYEDGSDPQVLDVIDIPLLEPRANRYQPENWLLDPEEYWARVERFPAADLDELVDKPGKLWLNGGHTFNGRNDQIPIDQAAAATSSIRLIRADRMQLKVFAPGEAFGNTKRRVQARFRWGGDEYWLWVTDPIVERAYLGRQDGDYEMGRHYLTVSVGEPYNGFCYKLVAAVIGPDPATGAA
jgi:hypothetical protein